MGKVKPDNPAVYQVGIVLATYNPDLNLLEQQLQSIQQQDYPNWQCLVVDDASSPERQSAIAQLLQADQRFFFHCQPHNLGSYHNFEYGLRYFWHETSCSHIAFADQDDLWYPHKLTRLLQEMAAQHAVLAHSDLALIDTQGTKLHSSVWQYEGRFPEKLNPQLLLLRNTVTGCTVMIRRSLIPELLPFPKQTQSGDWYHDHWAALVAAHTGKIAHIREPLVQYRQHGSNVVGAQKQAGSIRIEIALWLAKKGRLTLQSYRIHHCLSEAFYQRFYPTANHKKINPFSKERLDFGCSILKLGLYSFLVGYGSQGITLRLVVNKVIFDLTKIGQYVQKMFLYLHR